jgi:uncharacterized protein (DUF58 family)
MHNLFWSLIVLVAIAALLRMDWVYYLVYVVGGIWIFSHWSVRRAFSQLQVQREMAHQAFTGEKIPVSLRLSNRSWLPMPWLMFEERVPLDLKDTLDYRYVLSIGSRATVRHEYTLACKRRGYYPVGPIVLSTGDLFGFAEAAWQEKEPTHVTVYPQVVGLHELGLPSRSPFGVLASRQRIFEDPNRMSGVREYISGDSQRRIHWKASAHENTLLVKKFQPAIALNVAVVLDLDKNAYPTSGAISASEWAIIIAASLASYVTGQRQPVGLLSNGVDSVTNTPVRPIPTRQGQNHLMAILTALARIQMQEAEERLATWLPRQITDLEWGTTLIVVTPQLDEATIWTLHNAYRRGSNVLVLVCAAQPNFEALRAQADRLNVTVHRTIWEKDLHAL